MRICFEKFPVPHANKQYIGAFEICLPTVINQFKKMQKEICKCIDMVIAKRKENQQLKSLRDWLLPMLMNGQATVGEE